MTKKYNHVIPSKNYSYYTSILANQVFRGLLDMSEVPSDYKPFVALELKKLKGSK